MVAAELGVFNKAILRYEGEEGFFGGEVVFSTILFARARFAGRICIKENVGSVKARLECSACLDGCIDVDWCLVRECSRLTRNRKAEGVGMICEEAIQYGGLS